MATSLSPAALPDAVAKTLERSGVRHALKRVVVGVSGGADSTALAVLLPRLVAGTDFALVHVDHSLPEAEPPEDGVAVQTLAQELGLPCFEKHVDVPSEMDRSGESLEMAARRLRHAALQEAARDFNADAIALGHNADDQVETLLLRFARGTGSRGLGGMAVWQPGGNGGTGLLRPLLECPRKAIRDWLAGEGFPWREDPTNAEDDVLRNRVRHLVLPALYEALGENARNGFLRTADLLRDEESNWLGPIVVDAEQACRKDGALGLDCEKTRSLSPPLARRLLLREAQRAGLPPDVQTGDMLARLEELVLRPDMGSLSLDLGHGFRAVRAYGSLRVEAPSQTTRDGPSTLRVEEAVGFERTDRGDLLARPCVGYVSRAKIPDAGTLHVRLLRDGDRLHAVGAPGSRKISDILIDRKIPKEERGRVEAVCLGERVVWLPGHSVDAEFAVESATAPSWRCTVLRGPRRG